MSDINLSGNLSNEKFYSLQAGKGKEQAEQKERMVKQDPSTSTGVQWAATQPAPQAQASSQAVNSNSKLGADNKVTSQAKDFELASPSLEDVAVLTTTVSMKDESVEAQRPGLIRSVFAEAINMGALESAYRESFKKSKSHNLLLERFMANVKFSAVKSLMTMMGVSGDEQVKIQAEVREQALAEIDSKLKNDWAYTKAMLEITQG